MRTTKFALASVCAGLAFAIAGCNSEPEPEPTPTQEANPDMPNGISVADARLVLPAVKGNPGAVYFTMTNVGGKDYEIAGIDVLGAGSGMLHKSDSRGMEMIETVPLPGGSATPFKPGGYHGMIMDLPEDLAAGGETEVTVTFDNGDKASFPAAVEAPGA